MTQLGLEGGLGLETGGQVDMLTHVTALLLRAARPHSCGYGGLQRPGCEMALQTIKRL